MRLVVGLVVAAVMVGGCGKSSGTVGAGGGKGEAVAVHAPAGDPAKLPKVGAEAGKIQGMLKERFGEAVGRNVRVEVSGGAGRLKVSLRGEVPNEEIRQAVMKEVETRVEGIKEEDFVLELAGPVRMVFGFVPGVQLGEVVAVAPDLSLMVTKEGRIFEMATGRRVNRMVLGDRDGFGDIRSMAFSSDGKRLVTGHINGAIVLWEMPLGRDPKVVRPAAERNSAEPVERISAVAFMRGDKQVAAVYSQKWEVVVWDIEKGLVADGRGACGGAWGAVAGGVVSDGGVAGREVDCDGE